MIAAVRSSYAQRVAGNRVGAGARNVASANDGASIEGLTDSKRTGAQEESLLQEGAAERRPAVSGGSEPPVSAAGNQAPIAGSARESQRSNEVLRAALEAYRFTLEKLDQEKPRPKPGDVFDAPS